MLYLDKLQKNISLAPYTTFKIGGKAKYFYIAKSTEDLIGAVKLAEEKKLPFFILGGGSKILVSDEGFDGLVIKIKSQKSKVKSNIIYADAGVLLSKVVDESIKAGLTGLEWAAGIPGTIGGAIRGNAGAFGISMADITKTVTVLKIPESQVLDFRFQDLKFGYRDSIFKHNKDLIILSAELELEEGSAEAGKKLIKDHLEFRKKYQPRLSSAGCIFKNPAPEQGSMRGRIPFRSAGQLIEEYGLNGKKVGEAMIYKKHGNFIVNLRNAKAKDVKKLIDLCKEKVMEKFGIRLEEEIEYLGKF